MDALQRGRAETPDAAKAMIAHIVLFKPRPDLSHSDRQALLDAVRLAFTNIEEIRRVRIGRRRILGRPYDALARVDFEFAVVIEFASERELRAYLEHPAHIELGRYFGEMAEAALAYDYAMVEPERIVELLN